jgi:hypothetical protein
MKISDRQLYTYTSFLCLIQLNPINFSSIKPKKTDSSPSLSDSESDNEDVVPVHNDTEKPQISSIGCSKGEKKEKIKEKMPIASIKKGEKPFGWFKEDE